MHGELLDKVYLVPKVFEIEVVIGVSPNSQVMNRNWFPVLLATETVILIL